MFLRNMWPDLRNLWVVLVFVIVSQFLFSNTSLSAGAPLVYTTTLYVECASLKSFTVAPKKIADIGAFTLNSSGSTVDATFNGRIYVKTLEIQNPCAFFELRVDDKASTNGMASAVVKSGETGVTGGVPVSIMGIFTGLSKGTHSISMWARGCNGGGTDAAINPGCFESDHLVIKEFRSFELTYLPSISK